MLRFKGESSRHFSFLQLFDSYFNIENRVIANREKNVDSIKAICFIVFFPLP